LADLPAERQIMKKLKILFLALIAVAVIGVAATMMNPRPDEHKPCGTARPVDDTNVGPRWSC
jgi:hypothetical protein